MREVGEHTHTFFVQFVFLLMFQLFVLGLPFPFMFEVLSLYDGYHDDRQDT